MSGILPKPEDVTLSDLRRLLALKDDAKVRELIARVPGIDELERKLNSSVLLCDLDVEGTIIARDMLARWWGWLRADVDRELVEHIAGMPWRYEPGRWVPEWRWQGPAAPPPSGDLSTVGTTQAPPPPDPLLTASGKAIGAAYELLSEGKVVTISAAARRAGVNRSHVYDSPEAIRLIKALATPNGRPPRGSKDRDTGKLEAWDNDK